MRKKKEKQEYDLGIIMIGGFIIFLAFLILLLYFVNADNTGTNICKPFCLGYCEGYDCDACLEDCCYHEVEHSNPEQRNMLEIVCQTSNDTVTNISWTIKIGGEFDGNLR